MLVWLTFKDLTKKDKYPKSRIFIFGSTRLRANQIREKGSGKRRIILK
jgi:hypothetical protein